ncbi:hypothetical protein MPSEU_000627000 [Mayamaea pseudoterrestris]|nr:hypothetical protein MPSEU_000627000 [Mayamaea pseudoterrestris]
MPSKSTHFSFSSDTEDEEVETTGSDSLSRTIKMTHVQKKHDDNGKPSDDESGSDESFLEPEPKSRRKTNRGSKEAQRQYEKNDQTIKDGLKDKLTDVDDYVKQGNVDSILTKSEEQFKIVCKQMSKAINHMRAAIKKIQNESSQVGVSNVNVDWETIMAQQSGYYEATAKLLIAYVVACTNLDLPLFDVEEGGDEIQKLMLHAIASHQKHIGYKDQIHMMHINVSDAVAHDSKCITAPLASQLVPGAVDYATDSGSGAGHVISYEIDSMSKHATYANIMALLIAVGNALVLGDGGASNDSTLRRFLQAAYKKDDSNRKLRSTARSLAHLVYGPVSTDPLFDASRKIAGHVKNPLSFATDIFQNKSQTKIGAALCVNVIHQFMASTLYKNRMEIFKVNEENTLTGSLLEAKRDLLAQQGCSAGLINNYRALFNGLKKLYRADQDPADYVMTTMGTGILVSFFLRKLGDASYIAYTQSLVPLNVIVLRSECAPQALCVA